MIVWVAHFVVLSDFWVHLLRWTATSSDAGLLRLGSQELDVLLGHFGEPKTSCDGMIHVAAICEESCRQEFLTFKRAAVRQRDKCGQSRPAGMLGKKKRCSPLYRTANPYAWQVLQPFSIQLSRARRTTTVTVVMSYCVDISLHMLLFVCLTEWRCTGRLSPACAWWWRTQRLSAASDARTTEMPWLIVACLCVMEGNAETERCFSCQNHRDALVDCRLPVRDGGEHRDWALLQLPEPQRCTGWLSPACAWWWGTQRLSAASVARTTEMPWLIVACLCVMVGNTETERCFSCQNHSVLAVCLWPSSPGGLVVTMRRFHRRSRGSIPRLGTMLFSSV